MIEILHTPDAAHAEIVRLALEAEGIKVRSVDDTYDPYLHRHVLSVREADAARAIDIRRPPGLSTPRRQTTATFTL